MKRSKNFALVVSLVSNPGSHYAVIPDIYVVPTRKKNPESMPHIA
jgi:hypothetical protein